MPKRKISPFECQYHDVKTQIKPSVNFSFGPRIHLSMCKKRICLYQICQFNSVQTKDKS